MGFFSSRRSGQFDAKLVSDDSARVVRSRFYGKAKGKERDVDAEFYPRSPPSRSTTSFINTPDKPTSYPTSPSIRSGISRTERPRVSAPSSPALARRLENVSDVGSSRSSVDAITMTLAQRLNELATANSQGLLSDDEYRLLRQNLFERFASNSPIPTETPLVKMVGQSTRNSYTPHARSPSSNFQVQTSRPSSVQSKRSFTSSVSNLIRRATSKRSISMHVDHGRADTNSVYSMVSSNGEQKSLHTRALSKQLSDSSLRVDTSSRVVDSRVRLQADSMYGSDHGTPPSIRSARRLGKSAPPSSFPSAVEPSYATSMNIDAIPSDDQVESIADIRHQMELVEAEGRRLLDAFNGLELSTLTRRQKRTGVVSVPSTPTHGSAPEGRLPTATPWLERPPLRAGKDTDGVSFKSNGSGRTTLSVKRTPSMKMRPVQSSSALSQTHSIIPRKGSISSMSTRSRGGTSVVTSPSQFLHQNLGSTSSVNLTTRSNAHLPLATVSENEGKPQGATSHSTPVSPVERAKASAATRPKTFAPPEDEDLQAMQAELADIRRRRAEVTARYDARLEYLRARLKGAELREKILRK